jgi:methionyl-tRNA formyltransferase
LNEVIPPVLLAPLSYKDFEIQPRKLVEFTKSKLAKEDGRIDWGRGVREIVDLVRGVNPWPGASTSWEGRPVKVWKAAAAVGPWPAAAPGTVLAAAPREGLIVAAGDGPVSLTLVQAEGKKALPAAEFLTGHPIPAGTVLG